MAGLTPIETDQSGIEIYTCDGIFLKQYRFPLAGMVVPQHSHAHPHLTMLVRGAVHVWKNGEHLGRFDAPRGIEIEAGCKHTFQTIEAGTELWCLHNLKDEKMVRLLEEHELSFEDASGGM